MIVRKMSEKKIQSVPCTALCEVQSCRLFWISETTSCRLRMTNDGVTLRLRFFSRVWLKLLGAWKHARSLWSVSNRV